MIRYEIRVRVYTMDKNLIMDYAVDHAEHIGDALRLAEEAAKNEKEYDYSDEVWHVDIVVRYGKEWLKKIVAFKRKRVVK